MLKVHTSCRMVGFALRTPAAPGADPQIAISEMSSEMNSGEGPAAEGVPTDAVVVGVRFVVGGELKTLRARHTVLATGGYANDRTPTSLLAEHRPDLLRFPTTNGEWATGDGMKMGMALGDLISEWLMTE